MSGDARKAPINQGLVVGGRVGGEHEHLSVLDLAGGEIPVAAMAVGSHGIPLPGEPGESCVAQVMGSAGGPAPAPGTKSPELPALG